MREDERILKSVCGVGPNLMRLLSLSMKILVGDAKHLVIL